MPLHTFVRFDAKPGQLEFLRRELLCLLNPTRAEPGCLDIHLFEEKGPSGTFVIHSRWQDEAAFNNHVELPHMKRFRALVPGLVTNTVKAIRTHQID
jgi:quinol monooxygenase YgiN